MQLGLAFAAIAWIRLRSLSGRWLLHPDDLIGPRFRFGYTLRFAIATLVIVPAILVGYIAMAGLQQIEAMTGVDRHFGRFPNLTVRNPLVS